MGSLVLMVKKCMLTAAKKYYYVPIRYILAGFGLLIWYLIIGGSPKLFGYKLFQMQEAYCFPFITGLESELIIGLIPANSAYRLLFKHTGLHACIYSGDDRAILWSGDWKEEDKKEAEKGEGDLRLRREEIAGGYICWIEDLTAIRKLNREIAEVTEELEDENELIRQENALRSERVGIETRNRLYNRIAKAVRPTALRVNELLEKEEPENIREDLIYAAFLSAYIKRMGNLILLTDGNEGTESGELALSVGESMEYLKLNGCACELMSVGSGRIASGLAILAYELFECVMEDIWSSIGCCAVELGFENGFYLMISTDVRAGAVTSAWKDRELQECGGRLSVRYEDETFYIRLEAGL
ncbi:MAG: hypothetical protein K5696_09375 [Lachnospiraceae bacterium]|nr:hypothetical protein [Lachnospiraceae bacterium]